MGKYNRSQLMKDAWRTYKYVGKKKGQTFGEVLKSTWRLAKMHISMAENAAKAKAKMDAEYNKRMEARKNEKPAKAADYKGYISHEALYGRSFVSGGYCGD